MTLSLIVLSTEHWDSKRQARKELLYKALTKSGHVRYLAYVEPMAYWWRKDFRTWQYQDGLVHIYKWRCPFPGERYFPVLSANRFYQALKIRRILPQSPNKLFGIFYHPTNWLVAKKVRFNGPWIFDWTDDWGVYHHSGRIARLQIESIRDCDGVVTVSQTFFERAKDIRGDNKVLHLANATDLRAFNGLEEPIELKKIKHPRIGFMGHLGPWVDVTMIKQVARRFPDYQWCILGHAPSLLKDEMEVFPNIHFFGVQDYFSMPKWMMFMDILAAPYIQSELGIDASKIYDYLTSGKPIISSSNDTISGFSGLIEIADTIEDWERAIRKCLQEKESHRAQLRKDASADHTWTNRAQKLSEWLNKSYS
ncbi:hypothetical protein OAC89_05500 [Deltaproteobacteria bacterium]|nr:hypothetical protein [Deltaproteobacteria bacterium]